MLTGKLPLNWHMNDKTSDSRLNGDKYLASMKYRQADVVLFFVSSMCLPLLKNRNSTENKNPDIKENAEVKLLQEQHEIVSKAGINPIVLISQCDKLVKDKNFLKNPLANYPKLERARKKVANWLCIPRHFVLPCVSYTNSSYSNGHPRSCGIDLLAYRILDRALRNALEHRSNVKSSGPDLGIPTQDSDGSRR